MLHRPPGGRRYFQRDPVFSISVSGLGKYRSIELPRGSAVSAFQRPNVVLKRQPVRDGAQRNPRHAIGVPQHQRESHRPLGQRVVRRLGSTATTDCQRHAQADRRREWYVCAAQETRDTAPVSES